MMNINTFLLKKFFMTSKLGIIIIDSVLVNMYLKVGVKGLIKITSISVHI
jgi:hypothetical protein